MSSVSTSVVHPTHIYSRQRIAQNFFLIWLDSDVWKKTQKHFYIMKRYLKICKKNFLQIIPIWLLHTIISIWCITILQDTFILRESTWHSTKKSPFWSFIITFILQQYGRVLESIFFCQKLLKIRQKDLPTTHLDLAESCNSIGTMYYKMKEYSKVVSFLEHGVKIG
jgi:hypothetical protein